jgi:hypothetical protein
LCSFSTTLNALARAHFDGDPVQFVVEDITEPLGEDEPRYGVAVGSTQGKARQWGWRWPYSLRGRLVYEFDVADGADRTDEEGGWAPLQRKLLIGNGNAERVTSKAVLV